MIFEKTILNFACNTFCTPKCSFFTRVRYKHSLFRKRKHKKYFVGTRASTCIVLRILRPGDNLYRFNRFTPIKRFNTYNSKSPPFETPTRSKYRQLKQFTSYGSSEHGLFSNCVNDHLSGHLPALNGAVKCFFFIIIRQ